MFLQGEVSGAQGGLIGLIMPFLVVGLLFFIL